MPPSKNDGRLSIKYNYQVIKTSCPGLFFSCRVSCSQVPFFRIYFMELCFWGVVLEKKSYYYRNRYPDRNRRYKPHHRFFLPYLPIQEYRRRRHGHLSVVSARHGAFLLFDRSRHPDLHFQTRCRIRSQKRAPFFRLRFNVRSVYVRFFISYNGLYFI